MSTPQAIEEYLVGEGVPPEIAKVAAQHEDLELIYALDPPRDGIQWQASNAPGASTQRFELDLEYTPPRLTIYPRVELEYRP